MKLNQCVGIVTMSGIEVTQDAVPTAMYTGLCNHFWYASGSPHPYLVNM